MKILCIPDWRKNPYQRELEEGLGKLGAVCEFDSCFGWSLVIKLITGSSKPDVIHLHWTTPIMWTETRIGTFFKMIGVLVKLNIFKLFGVKFVWTVHNLMSHDSIYPKMEYFYNRRIACLANRIIAHGEHAKEEIVKFYRVNVSKITVVAHGHYINSYPNTISPQEARNKLDLSEDAFVVLYIGIIRAYKGIEQLIESFKECGISSARLLIVGKPNEEEVVKNIEQLASGNAGIKLIFDYVPDEEMQIYMQASNIVALPYRDIFTSGAVLLAMSFAKPVIASRKGSIPEVLDEQGGFLCDVDDSGDLTKMIKESFNKGTDDLEAMGQHNLEKVKQYDWQGICTQTKKIYEECLN